MGGLWHSTTQPTLYLLEVVTTLNTEYVNTESTNLRDDDNSIRADPKDLIPQSKVPNTTEHVITTSKASERSFLRNRRPPRWLQDSRL